MKDKEESESLLSSGSRKLSTSYGSIARAPTITTQLKFLCTRRDTIVVVTALLLAFIVITTTLVIGLPQIKEKKRQYFNTTIPASASPLKSFKNAVVVADGELCSSIGKAVLEKNGSAVDAAIASLFCNGVVNPESMGLGGGFFMVIYLRDTGISEVIDARETAPSNASHDMYHSDSKLSQIGGLAIAVPGELQGYWTAHQKYGNLQWSDLIEPSMNICRDGFEVSKHLAEKLKLLENNILAMPNMRSEFYNNDTSELYKEGEIMKRPVLQNTLSIIADKGVTALYDGELTQQFLQDIEHCGGIITDDDLRTYKPKVKAALKVDIPGLSQHNIHTVPPPGSGIIVSLILKILQGYEINPSSIASIDDTVLTYHRIVEAFKFAFAQREQLADEDFAQISDVLKQLASQEFADSIRKKINDKTTFEPEYYEAAFSSSQEDHGTSHVSVLAANGDAVSATSTINTYFGSLCRSPSTGIILNNDMDDFSSPNITNYFGLPPFPRNFIEPGKRPLSSMAPSILTDESGDVQVVVGGMGGTRIISSTAQVLMGLLWLNETVKQAIDFPRLHHQLLPNYIQHEKDFPKVYLDRLKNFGHTLKPETASSAILAIMRKVDHIEANVDYRKGGSCDGF